MATTAGDAVICLRRRCAIRLPAGSAVWGAIRWPWSVCVGGGDSCEVAGAVPAQIGAVGEVLALQAVGVLVGAVLPGLCGSHLDPDPKAVSFHAGRCNSVMNQLLHPTSVPIAELPGRGCRGAAGYRQRAPIAG